MTTNVTKKDHCLSVKTSKSSGETSRESKHLKGQFGPPVNDKKMSDTKNDHFLKRPVCQVSWDPCESGTSVCHEKLSFQPS